MDFLLLLLLCGRLLDFYLGIVLMDIYWIKLIILTDILCALLDTSSSTLLCVVCVCVNMCSKCNSCVYCIILRFYIGDIQGNFCVIYISLSIVFFKY